MELEQEFELTPQKILEIIQRSPRAKQLVKGFIAEFKLEEVLFQLKKDGKIEDFNRIDKDSQPDFRVLFKRTEMTVECKNVMSGTIFSDGSPKVDFQRTRNARDDPTSRFYTVDDFDVLAACMHNQTGKWEFLFIRTRDLDRDIKYGDPYLRKSVKVRKEPPWENDLVKVLDAVNDEYRKLK